MPTKSSDECLNDKRLNHLLTAMPEAIRSCFTSSQLKALQNGLTETSWKKHAVDFRGSIPFFSYHYYWVFIAGRDQRTMTREEIRFKRLALLSIFLVFMTFSTLLGLLVIYLTKSALGIDVFPNFSFGIWNWFQNRFLM